MHVKPSTKTPTVPTINLASVVYGLEDYLRERDADPAEVLRRAELDSEDLLDPERRVPLIRYLELLELCAAELEDTHFGLKFGARYDPRHAGVVGNVALASRTVGEALQTIGRYLPTMVDSAVFGLEVEGDKAFAYSYYVDPLLMGYQQKNDWAVAFVCNVIRHGLSDPDWRPDEALFPHLPPEGVAERRARARTLCASIRVGHPWAGIRFDTAVLEWPLKTADGMIERLMRHYGDLRLSGLEGRDEIAVLRRNIAQLLVHGESSIEQLARRVGWSVRTLQRRLAARGVKYSDLLDDVRKTLALNLLENRSLCIAQIAYSVGYSDVSAFNHAFRRWIGQAPGDYRKSQRLQPDR
ncbi:MAG TPA: AraC family transcriptional regulator [Gammaproteobacteria bacterium]|nr:AraC family transcriptional regulator [Gammaproteobacteria bacterium]